MDQNFYRTGAAAKQLGVSPYRIRALCQAGLIANAECTEGGQWLIPACEVGRLSKNGVPPTPKTIVPTGAGNARLQANRNQNPLLAPASGNAIDAAEEAYIEDRQLTRDNNRLQRMRVRKEATELADFFEDREARRLQREIEEDRREAEITERRRREWEEQSAAQERRAFETEWLGYAINSEPWDAPPDYAVVIQEPVLSALSAVSSAQDHWTVRSIIDAAIARALQPWRNDQVRLKAKHRAVESALSGLPFWMKHDEAWGSQARQIAEEAVDSARDGATASQMAVVAKLALNPLRTEYEHAERIKQAMTFVFLRDSNGEDTEDAKTAVREALEGLPVGASDRQIEAAKATALEPIRERIADRLRQESEGEERRRGKRRLMDLPGRR